MIGFDALICFVDLKIGRKDLANIPVQEIRDALLRRPTDLTIAINLEY